MVTDKQSSTSGQVTLTLLVGDVIEVELVIVTQQLFAVYLRFHAFPHSLNVLTDALAVRLRNAHSVKYIECLALNTLRICLRRRQPKDSNRAVQLRATTSKHTLATFSERYDNIGICEKLRLHDCHRDPPELLPSPVDEAVRGTQSMIQGT